MQSYEIQCSNRKQEHFEVVMRGCIAIRSETILGAIRSKFAAMEQKLCETERMENTHRAFALYVLTDWQIGSRKQAVETVKT